MKELSIEEKAKAYDEAIERAKQLSKELTVDDIVEQIFPKLKESKGERIRKALIDYFRWNPNSQLLNEFTNREVFAWLEKQGKNNMSISEATKQKLEDNLNKALEKETPESCNEFLEKQSAPTEDELEALRIAAYEPTKNWSEKLQSLYEKLNHYEQGEQKSIDDLTPQEAMDIAVAKCFEECEQKSDDKVEPKFKVGDYIKPIDKCLGSPRIIEEVYDGWYVTDKGALYFEFEDNWELVENPVWSEEDEQMLKVAINSCEQCGNEYVYYWLKSLKGKVQPKQEWGQNDIDMIDWLIRCCEKEHEELCNDKYGHQDIVSELKRDCRKKWNWLESLKNKVVPQNRWKPSDEQMERLKGTINSLPHQEVLYSLYQDLKKLRGE